MQGRNTTSYCIQYKFQTPDGETRNRSMNIGRRYYNEAVVGADIVVLYELKRDGSFQSLICDFSDYVAG